MNEKKKMGQTSHAVLSAKTTKTRQRTSPETGIADLKRRYVQSEKSLKQELKSRTLEVRLAQQNLKQALAECKKVEEIYEQKSAILEAVIENAGGPVFSVDRRYCYTSFNLQHAQVMKGLFGADIEIGKNLLDYHTNPDDRTSARKNLDRTFRGEMVVVESYAGGDTKFKRCFEIIHNPIRSSNGKVVGASVYARDVTTRKQVDAQIESLAKFPSENPNPVMRASAKGVLLYANKASQPLLDEWQATIDQPLPAFWQQIITEAQGEKNVVDLNCGGKVFSFMVCAVPETGYFNLYGREITERIKAEAETLRLLAAVQAEKDRLAALVDNITDEVWFADTNKKFTLVNPAGLREFGVDPGNVVDVEKFASGIEVYRSDGSPRPFDETPPLRALKGEFVNNLEEVVRFPGSRQLHYREVNAAPVRGPDGGIIGAVSVVRDITGRKQAEQKLNQLNRTLRALSNTNQAMMRAASEEEYLDSVCRIVVEDCGHAMVWVGYKEMDKAKSVRPVASAGFEEGYLETLKITWDDSDRGRGPTGTAIRTGKPSLCHNMLTDPKFAPWREQALKRGYASSLVLPLMDGDQTFGAISIYARLPEAFSEQEQNLLTELAGDLAFGIMSIRTREAHALAEVALQESEQRYHSLFNSMTEGFALHEIICDEDGKPCDYRFLDINPAFERLTGLRREDVLGRTHNEVLPEDSPEWVESYGKAALSGEPVSFENYSPALQKHFEVFAYQPMPRQFAVIFMDITERKRMEDELRIAKAEMERHAVELDAIFESMAETVIVYDASGRLVRANKSAIEMLGFDPRQQEVEGVVRRLIPHRMDGQAVPAEETPPKRALRGERVTGEHYTITNSQGRTMHRLGSAAPLWVGGQLAGAVTVWQDITDVMEMEESLRESEQRFRLALRNAPVSVATQDRNLRFLWAYNQRTVDPSSVVGKTDTDLFPKEDAARLMALKRKVLETEKEISEQLWINSGNKRLFLDLFIEPLRDVTGQVTGLGIATVDLTPMKLAEQAMSQARDELELRVQERARELVLANQQLQAEVVERKQAETKLRLQTKAIEAAANGIIITDRNGIVEWCNPAVTQVTGYECDEIIGRTPRLLKSSQHDSTFYKRMWETILAGRVWHGEMINRRKDKSLYTEEQVITPVRDEDGQITHFIAVKQDISARKRSEEALRQASMYNRSLIEAGLDPFVTITPEGKISDVNNATEKVTGFTRQELIGTDFHSYFSDPDKARAGYQKVFETGTVRDYDLEIRNKDGTITPVLYNASIYRDETGKVMGVFAVARDITDRKHFETQLVQAEKHAVIGRMVGSITHEINNPLQTIKNCLYLIQQDVTAESPMREPLDMVTSETLRLTNLVGQLRELYRPKVGIHKHPHELLDILEEAHSLLIPHLNNARVEWQPLTGLQRCYINCVRDQVLEVFLNISMNAIEAMHHRGGTLFVDMSVSEDWAAVIFRDTGPGIPEEIMPHLFEPFMTTKASGLGLGLSIIYGIVQRHGGQIQVDNQPGQGASFTVLLPLKSYGGGEEESKHGNE